LNCQSAGRSLNFLAIATSLGILAASAAVGANNMGSLDLELLSNEAKTTHPSIYAAAAAVDAAAVDISGARAAYLPYLSVNGAYGNNDTSTATAVAVQPLYGGGLVRATVTERKAARRQQLALMKQSMLDISQQVSNGYLNAVRARKNTQQWLEYTHQLQNLEQTIHQRIKNGIASEVDAQTVATRISQALSGLVGSQADHSVARSQLRALFQRDILPSQWPQKSLELSEAELVDIRLEQRFANHPLVMQEQSLVDQQLALAKQQKASLWPQLSLQYSHRLHTQAGDFTPESALQLVLTAQTNNAYQGITGLRAANSRATAAALRLQAVQRQLKDQLSVASAQRRAAQNLSQSRAEAVASADRQKEGYFRQFQAGRRGWLELLNIERETHQAGLDMLDSEYQYWQATMVLRINSQTDFDPLELLRMGN
jgi:adhesin transport system outer membrane protein